MSCGRHQDNDLYLEAALLALLDRVEVLERAVHLNAAWREEWLRHSHPLPETGGRA